MAVAKTPEGRTPVEYSSFGRDRRLAAFEERGIVVVDLQGAGRSGDEILSVSEVGRRIGSSAPDVMRLVELDAFAACRDDARGLVGILWREGTERRDLLPDWVAANAPLTDDEGFAAYQDLLSLVGSSRHVDGVPRQAYDFLRAQGAAVNADELSGLIGLERECHAFLKDVAEEEGRFVPLRSVNGGAGVVPHETVADVLARLGLKHRAEGTAADPRLRGDRQTLDSFQCRALLAIENESLFRSVALFVFIKLFDDVHPQVIVDALILARRLDHVIADGHVGKLPDVTAALDRYLVERTVLADDSDHRRATTVYFLYSLFETIADWADMLSDAKARTYFQSFQVALPRRSHKYIRMLQGMERRSARTALVSRKGRSDRLVAGYDLTRYAVEVRHAQMRRMSEAYEKACARVRAMAPEEREAVLPYEFHYAETLPAVGDEPEVSQLVLLRIDSRASMVSAVVAEPRMPDAWVRLRAPGGSGFDPATHDDLMLEYVDTVPSVPGGAVRPLWMLDVVRSGYFHPPACLSPADRRRRRAMMRELRLGPAAAKIARLFMGFGQKHLNGDAYRALRYCGRLFLPVHSMMMVSHVARVFIRVMTTNGARPSEVMMMQADPERWGEVYDLENRVQVTYFEAVPKGRDDWAVFFVDPDTLAAIDELIGFVSWRWYDGAPTPEVAPAKNLFRKTLHGGRLPAAPYVLQWRGHALDSTEYAIAMRTMLHGLGDWLPYDLRHAFATTARVERMPKDVLMKVMHHEREAMTDHYSDPTAQEKASFFTRFTLNRELAATLLQRGEDTLSEDEYRALNAIGALTKTPGGQCMNSTPCEDDTACMGCAFNRNDPAHRAEVVEMEEHARVALERAEAGGFGRYVEQERRNLADIAAQLREMDLVELARAQPVSPDVVDGHPEWLEAA